MYPLGIMYLSVYFTFINAIHDVRKHVKFNYYSKYINNMILGEFSSFPSPYKFHFHKREV